MPVHLYIEPLDKQRTFLKRCSFLKHVVCDIEQIIQQLDN